MCQPSFTPGGLPHTVGSYPSLSVCPSVTLDKNSYLGKYYRYTEKKREPKKALLGEPSGCLSLLHKGKPIFKITLQESHFGSLFSQCRGLKLSITTV